MKILKVPFTFNRAEFNKRVKIELYQGMEDEIEAILSIAKPLLTPKVLYGEFDVIHRDDHIEISDQKFYDPKLLNRVSDVKKIYPYLVTCGTELDNEDSLKGDMLADFWLDALKQMGMDRAFNYVRTHIKTSSNIDKLYSINPGSDTCGEGWNIEDQKILFKIFGSNAADIGVTLNTSYLMSPNKTVSGFMFKSDKDFVSCQECKNINCSNRRMIHDGAIVS